MTKSMINEFLKYDPETGSIIWVKERKNIKIGDKAGWADSGGYNRISFFGKKYLAHRIAWYLYYKAWPTGIIDHINGIKTDNKINNLREVTYSQNAVNTEKTRNGKLPYVGYDKNKKLFYVRISFKTEEEANSFVKQNIIRN